MDTVVAVVARTRGDVKDRDTQDPSKQNGLDGEHVCLTLLEEQPTAAARSGGDKRTEPQAREMDLGSSRMGGFGVENFSLLFRQFPLDRITKACSAGPANADSRGNCTLGSLMVKSINPNFSVFPLRLKAKFSSPDDLAEREPPLAQTPPFARSSSENHKPTSSDPPTMWWPLRVVLTLAAVQAVMSASPLYPTPVRSLASDSPPAAKIVY